MLLDDLDKAAVNALGYVRTLRPLALTALHVAVDPAHGRALADRWTQLRPDLDVPLELVACPDRDLPGTVRRVLAERARPDTVVTVLIPQHHYGSPLGCCTTGPRCACCTRLRIWAGCTSRSCPTRSARAATAPQPLDRVGVGVLVCRGGRPQPPRWPPGNRPVGAAARAWSAKTNALESLVIAGLDLPVGMPVSDRDEPEAGCAGDEGAWKTAPASP